MSGATDKKGVVLVAVLWVIVVLITVAVTVCRSSSVDTRICISGREELRCRWACRAGLETAVAVLNEDLRSSDSLTDWWSDNDEDFNDVPLDGCWFSVRVVDEAGKLNINTATKEQLMSLPNMTEDIADAIIDWRDEDETPGGGGVEGGYYRSLAFGYTIRNGPFKTIRELLLVKGVTEEFFYGEDTNFNGELDLNERDRDGSPPLDDGDNELDQGWIAYLTCYSYDNNKDAYGSNRVNINEADEQRLQNDLGIKRSNAKWIVDNRGRQQYKSVADLINQSSPKEPRESSRTDPNSAEPLDLQTFSAIVDKIAVSNDERTTGRVNINTASEVVLTALLGGDSKAYQIADEIVAYRNGLEYGMTSIGEVMNVESVSVGVFKEIANSITTRSDVYTVYCFASAQRGGGLGATVMTEAVLDRGSEPCKVLYWYQGACNR